MIRKTLYGTLTQDEELNENEKAMLYIKECAELVGLEVIEGKTAFSITFMAEIMKRLRKEPTKTGHWIAIDEEPHEDYECDNCGYTISTYTANIKPHTEYKFCPNCGARMVEPQESEDKE